MALMTYREPNQVRWVGIRPGHRGTQIIGDVLIENNTADILQITAGKKGYITLITLSIMHAAAGYVYLYWTDSLNAILGTLFTNRSAINTKTTDLCINFSPPFEIGDNHKIRLRSSDVAVRPHATVIGWEE